MQNNAYYIGKNGSFADICKNYTCNAELDILKGLKDRDHKDQRKLLIKLYREFDINFIDVCVLDIRPLIDYILENTPEKYILDCGLRGACQGGNIYLVDLMIKKGANGWNYGLCGACRGNHVDLIDLMIQKGADDWNSGFHGACDGGHMDLVNLMIEKGADDWDRGLEGACYGGYRDLVYLMIEKGANHWNLGLRSACYGGHVDLVDLMIEKGAYNWNWGLEGSCYSGHIGLVELMIEKGANDLNQGFEYAGNHWEIAEYLVMLGANCKVNEYKDYYEYLARKLIKTKTSMHGLYYELNYLVSLY